MPRFNLEFPNRLSQDCALDDLTSWALNEANSMTDSAPQQCIATVCKSLGEFVRWPAKAVLLWNGCERIAPPGEKQRIHIFPDAIKRAAKIVKAPLDTRSNGPAIVAFLVTGEFVQNDSEVTILGASIIFIQESFLTSGNPRHFMPQNSVSISRKAQALSPFIRLPMECATNIPFSLGCSVPKPFADLDTTPMAFSLIHPWINSDLFQDARQKSFVPSQHSMVRKT